MKKQTVFIWLTRQRDQARKEAHQTVRDTMRDTVEQCERWLSLPWAEMRHPVNEALGTLKAQVKLLIEKEQQGGISMEEALQLAAYRAQKAIYDAFLAKITPTAREAEYERAARQRERERRFS